MIELKSPLLQLRKLAPAALVLIAAACGDQTPELHTPLKSLTSQSELVEATDRLNQRLQARLDLMPAVALWKWQEKLPIEDLVREQLVLDRVAELAEMKGVCSDAARLFFQSQMDSAKAIQIKLLETWKINPPVITSDRTNMTKVREKIDAMTPEILDQWIKVQNLQSGK